MQFVGFLPIHRSVRRYALPVMLWYIFPFQSFYCNNAKWGRHIIQTHHKTSHWLEHNNSSKNDWTMTASIAIHNKRTLKWFNIDLSCSDLDCNGKVAANEHFIDNKIVYIRVKQCSQIFCNRHRFAYFWLLQLTFTVIN